MELIWLVLSLITIDLAAFLVGADTRPGLQHSSRGATSRWHIPRWHAPR